MRMTKKIIALVMAITMISTCGVATAFSAVKAGENDTAKPTYDITVTGATNATVTVKVGGSEVTKAEKGEIVTVTVAAKTGFTVESVTAAGVTFATTDPYTFTMPGNTVAITVATKTNEVGEYTISKAATTNGTFVTNVGGKSVEKTKAGDEVTVGATPAAGYEVDAVTCVETEGRKALAVTNSTFIMPAKGVTVTVTFKEVPASEKKITVNVANATASIQVEGKEVTTAKQGAKVTVRFTTTSSYFVRRVESSTAKLTGSGNVWNFTMPANDVVITAKTERAIVPDPISSGDVSTGSISGVKAGGTYVKEIEVSRASDNEIAQIEQAMDAELNAAGLEIDPAVASFGAVDITILDKDGEVLTGTLNKAIDITIRITTPGFKPTRDNLRIMHNHNGTIETIKPRSISYVGRDTYGVTFPMGKFSVVMPVAIRSESTGGGGGNSWNDNDYSGGGSSGGGSVGSEIGFDSGKMRITGGEIVLAKTVEDISGTDKVYTVNYRGKDYTFNGKNVPKPAGDVIFYTAEEFMKLVQGKLVSTSDNTDNESNPDTGANDFAGVAMALAMVSFVGIAACKVAKKKS